MVGRVSGVCGAVLAAAVVLSACGDDDAERSSSTDQNDVTSTTPTLAVDDEGTDDHTWSSGSATFELDGEKWEFALELCATEPNDPDADADTNTLWVEGTAVDDPGTTLRVVETVTPGDALEIQVVSVSFEDPDGTRLHTWEAQRVVDTVSGDVDDMHGDGTEPLLEVDEREELVVSVTDAVFWQFDMTGGGDDRTIGTGDLRATCTA